MPDLPWRVRVRLKKQHVIDAVAIWLVEKEQFAAATWLWRITGSKI